MKCVLLAVFVSVVTFASGSASGQVSAYGEFTTTHLSNPVNNQFIYGGTAGVLAGGPKFHALLLSIDLQSRFSDSGGTALNGVTLGPRIALQPYFLKLSPFAEVNIGFARYNSPTENASTDYIFGGQVGATRQISSRVALVADYSFSRFGYDLGEYRPQAFSIGAVFRLR
jgi:hypothetical protein